MQKIMCLTVVALTSVGVVRADDKAETRAIIDKAIKAMGGKEKLAKEKAATFKAKGKYYGMGAAIDYTGDFAVQPPDKLRFQMDFEVNGMKINFTFVFDGKKGWTKINDKTTAMDKEALAEAREDMYAGRVEALIPLVKAKGYELSPVGEVKVGDHDAVGIRVSHKGHRDINLFFDKKTGLLLKSERTIKDQMMGGKEMSQERLLSDYKEVDGVKRAMKVVIKRDGKKFVVSEISDLETKEKIDDSEFGKP
jgi:outer membrane lipoprotein-sorting protein